METPQKDNCFNTFNTEVNHIPIPTRFTFPFYYQPHKLSILAANQLQQELLEKENWQHDFGITESESTNSGKMFGVLVVQNKVGQLGFLKGFSGKLANTPNPQGFVPHVYDLLPGKNFFEKGMEKINIINHEIDDFENSPNFKNKEQEFKLLQSKANLDIEEVKSQLAKAKIKRSQLRKSQKEILSEKNYQNLVDELNKESVQKKFYFKHLQEHWQNKVSQVKLETTAFYKRYNELKAARKAGSISLQQQIFEHYKFLNAHGETQNLLDIFNTAGVHLPPAGAGDCAAPKLIQYAYKMGYQPICMAEFWWGQSPKSEIKKHQHFYPACTGKCQPILTHMLKGLSVDKNPMETESMTHLKIETIYEDDVMMVINKPSGLLSVPGKSITDSVANRLKNLHPDWTGPLIVHRLDMPTSGLMLVAKTLEIHKELQQQFLKRTIKKRYIALLDGVIENTKGTIDLPLRVDLDNRPHQLVCFQYGKSARTHYEVISKTSKNTRLYFYPVTGRTHQLRMHAAHKDGLNTPIIGDSLYGKIGSRLHLHAEYICFAHPVTKKIVELQIAPEF